MAPPEPDAAGVTRAILRLSWIVESEFRSHDLTPGQYRVLAQLSGGAEYASTIATSLAIRRPSFSAVADALVQRGLVQREVDGHDRRRVAYSLTGDGRVLLEQAEAGVEQRLAAIADELGDEAESAYSGLALWHGAARRASAKAAARRTMSRSGRGARKAARARKSAKKK